MSNIFTLCVVRNGNAVLVQKREKPPFIGYWNAPGGKVEPAESPEEACIREIMEETGLRLHDLRMRGVITVTSGRHETSVLVVFDSSSYEGDIIPTDEGDVTWLDIDQIYSSVQIPSSFTYLLPYIVESDGLVTGKFVYNRNRLEVCDLALQTY